ncbi:MAG: DUF1826 domain-containing protein [Pseudomonadota bacterium]
MSESEAGGVALTGTPEGMAAIHRPDCAAVIWRRDPLPRFTSWIDALRPECLPQARLILRPTTVRDAAHQLLAASQCPDCAERAMLADDTAALANLFASLMRAPFLRLRLDVVATNACCLFHTDAITARLICTYRGTGTQYGVSADGGRPPQIFTVPTGAPILLRGKLWPERPASGLLHRSPPIEGTPETRLVLVLDPIQTLDEVQGHEILH